MATVFFLLYSDTNYGILLLLDISAAGGSHCCFTEIPITFVMIPVEICNPRVHRGVSPKRTRPSTRITSYCSMGGIIHKLDEALFFIAI